MINGYTSIKNVIAKIYRDLDLSTDINEYHIAEWCAEVLDKIGTYYQYKEMKTCLELQNGRARLPLNFHRLVDIGFSGKPLSWASNTMYNDYACESCTIPSCCTEKTFYINDSYIITNIEETDLNSAGNNDICIIYLAIPVDAEGYPLIPDDVYFREACTYYVSYKLDYQKWRRGDLPDKILDESERQYLFYVRAAKGAANMPGERQLANLKNIWVRLLPLNNEENQFFVNNNKQERRYNK
jgi:hypothetical protein